MSRFRARSSKCCEFCGDGKKRTKEHRGRFRASTKTGSTMAAVPEGPGRWRCRCRRRRSSSIRPWWLLDVRRRLEGHRLDKLLVTRKTNRPLVAAIDAVSSRLFRVSLRAISLRPTHSRLTSERVLDYVSQETGNKKLAQFPRFPFPVASRVLGQG